MNKPSFKIASHFARKAPVVREIYHKLLRTLKQFGPIVEEPKKTSIHLVNATALAGVATRSNYLILTIKSNRELRSPRIHKTERVSSKRFHHEVKLTSPADVDAELTRWLKVAYEMSG